MARINAPRLMADLRELASIGAYRTGVERIALSAPDIEARRWLVGKLRHAGLDASMDRIGNVLGRDPAAGKAIFIGEKPVARVGICTSSSWEVLTESG